MKILWIILSLKNLERNGGNFELKTSYNRVFTLLRVSCLNQRLFNKVWFLTGKCCIFIRNSVNTQTVTANHSNSIIILNKTNCLFILFKINFNPLIKQIIIDIIISNIKYYYIFFGFNNLKTVCFKHFMIMIKV